MKINDLILKSNKILKNKGIQSYILDTQLLLAHFLGVDKLYIILNKDKDVEQYEGFLNMVNRRAENEPVAYILGKCEFMSLEFKVNTSTLIPRPDTETLVECVIDHIGDKACSMLEIGTGSGCIPISCLHYCRNLTATSADISQRAIEVAKENALNNNILDRINFICMDILCDFPTNKFDIVVSNPPYIETCVIDTLMDDVKNYEPYSALCGGDDGLIFYRRISKKAREVLNIGGFIAFEVGHNQSEAVKSILKNDGYKNITVIKDLSGINRVVCGEY